MITKDGYKVEEGMLLGTDSNEDLAVKIVSVSDDSAIYEEYEWDEEAEMFAPNGQGGLLWAEEIANEYEYGI